MLNLALLGSPLSHSLSPLLHGILSQSIGMPLRYWVLDSCPERFEEALCYAEHHQVSGANVTAPYKKVAYQLCTQLTETARKIGTVNTLKRTPKGWIGHNTDAKGFVQGVLNEQTHRSLGQVLLLGLGGAARGVYVGLLDALNQGKLDFEDVICVGRRQDAIQEWMNWHNQLQTRQDPKIKMKCISFDTLSSEKTQSRIPVSSFTTLISAISPLQVEQWNTLSTPWLSRLSPKLSVYDLNYGTRSEGSQKWAQVNGFKWKSGLDMLAWQGMDSFQFWTESPLNCLACLDQFKTKSQFLKVKPHQMLSEDLDQFKCKIRSFPVIKSTLS